MASANPERSDARFRMGAREWMALVLLSAIWGASFFFYRVMVRELPPFTLVFGRLFIAAVALHLFLRATGQSMRFPPRTWARFAMLAALNNAAPFTLIAYSETRIAAGVAALLHGSVPMMTALSAHIFTRDEKLTWNRTVGVMFGLAGIAVLIGRDALQGLGNADFIGELICLAGAVSYALGGVFSRTFADIPPLKVATGQVTMGAVVMLPLAFIVDHPWTLAALTPPVWGSLLAISLVGTSFAYVVFFRIIGRTGAANISLVTLMQPVSAVFLGWLFLNEAVTANAVAGMAVIAVGLVCIDGRIFRIGKAGPASPAA